MLIYTGKRIPHSVCEAVFTFDGAAFRGLTGSDTDLDTVRVVPLNERPQGMKMDAGWYWPRLLEAPR